MSEKIRSGLIIIIDDPGKRKKFLIALVVLLVIIIGLARYSMQENDNTGEVINAGNAAGQVIEISEQSSQSVQTEESETQAPDEQTIVQNEAPVAVFVDVGGAVTRSGVIALPPGSRIADAIEAAGGLTEYADISVINRAQIISDGDKLYIPTTSDVENGRIKPSVGLVTGEGSGSSVSTASQGSVTIGNAPGTDSQGRINLNAADSETLQLLNGVGPATAQKIIDYRNAHGQFKRIEDLMNVSGIGQKTFEKLKNEICV